MIKSYDLWKQIRKIIKLPESIDGDTIIEFSLYMRADETPKITLRYHPSPLSDEFITEQFRLERIEQEIDSDET